MKIAFQENVLELVGLIAQHMGTKTLKADAPAMLDLLHAIFSAFDPRSVLDADESVLLSRIKYVLAVPLSAACMQLLHTLGKHLTKLTKHNPLVPTAAPSSVNMRLSDQRVFGTGLVVPECVHLTYLQSTIRYGRRSTEF